MYKWTEEKIEILKESYPVDDWDTICKKLDNYNISSIKNMGQKLKLRRPRNWWTKEKEELLKECYPNFEWEDIFKIIGCNNKLSIIEKAYFLGIKRDVKEYSEEEIKFIKNNFAILSYEEIGKKLGRTTEAITQKINRMGLIKFSDWTDEEIKIFIENHSFYTNKELQEKFFPNRTVESICTMATKLKMPKKSVSHKKYVDLEKMICDLKILGEKLGRTPIGNELTKYGLPCRETYAKNFSTYTNACELAGLKLTSPFIGHGNHEMYKSSRNDNCYSKSEIIITEFLIDHNVDYTKECLYKNYISDTRCGQKRVDWVLNNKIFVEFFGFPKRDFYQRKIDIKKSICVDNNIVLIEIYDKDLNNLDEIFKDYI